jgi:hypothetical protein
VAADEGHDVKNDELLRVDPRFAPEHAAFYLIGLQRHCGHDDIRFDRTGFIDRYSDNKPVAFVLRRQGVTRRIFIGPDDMTEVDLGALEWADVYGKVNLLPELVPSHSVKKVVPIGPSHAVRAWSLPGSVRMALRAHASGGRIVGVREHYRSYWLQYRRRQPASAYEPSPAEASYVFYNAWLWAKHGDVNPPRAEFIRACRDLQPEITFEGGFTGRRRNDVPEYSDLLASRPYSLPEYLERIKRSTVVFNNPAVHGCLGWKLAEFLRLGKAIISLPLSRAMPAPFLHGEHAHFVDGGAESIQEAVRLLVRDRDYRAFLESNARDYYLRYLAPERVIARLANAAFADGGEGHR